MTEYGEIRAQLESQRSALERRLGHIRSDRHREQGPLDADSEEQAVELENAPVLDALDESGRAELAAILAALDRIDAGRFGRCEGCGDEIAAARLQAVPTATRCRDCAV